MFDLAQKLQAEQQDALRELAERQVAHHRQITAIESKQGANLSKKRTQAPVMRLLLFSHLASYSASWPAGQPVGKLPS